MSAAIAEREKRQTVPGTPELKKNRKAELIELEHSEQVITKLTGWNTAMHHPTIADDHESAAFLLELNIGTRTLKMGTYRQDKMLFAHADYLAREKATEHDPNIQVVLVSADSVANLKRAYPNFYVDTTVFIKAIEQEIY